jgi:hypothetical protein
VLGHRRRRLHLRWRLLRRCRSLRWSLHCAGDVSSESTTSQKKDL